MNVPMFDCYEGCCCKACIEKTIPGSVESGLAFSEGLGEDVGGTVKSDPANPYGDKTGNDAGGVF